MNYLLAAAQLLSGTAAGFITNKYAVKWLFKPVTVFGRGVLDVSLLGTEEKRRRFIDSLSECVEKQILTPETLEAQICSEVFLGHIGDMLQDFFDRSLIAALGTKTADGIKDFQEVKSSLLEIVLPPLERALPEITEEVFKDISLRDVISEDSMLKAAGVAFDAAVEALDAEKIADAAAEACARREEARVNEIISEELASRAAQAVFGEKYEELVNSAFKAADAEGLARSFGEKYGSVPLRAFVKDENALESKLYAAASEYIKTDKFKSAASFAVKKATELLSSADVTVYDIISGETRGRLENFISLNIPKAVPALRDFIDGNREEIELLIDDAIEKSGASPTVNRLIFGIIDIPQQLTRIIEQIENGDTEEISKRLILALDSVTIGEIVNRLEGADTDGAKKLAGALSGKYGRRIIHKLVSAILDKCPNDFIKDYSAVSEGLKRAALRGRQGLRDSFEKRARSLFALTLPELSDEYINGKNAEKLIRLLKDNKNEIVRGAVLAAYGKSDKADIKELSRKTAGAPRRLADAAEKKYGKRKIRGFIYLLKRSKKFKSSVTRFIPRRVTEGIMNSLDGRIKSMTSNSLEKLDTDQLYDIAEGLMAGQLKYLSYFGALVGFVISLILLPASVRFTGSLGFPATVPSGLLSVFAMGFIGVITNVIAIGMFFRPYKPIKFLKKHLSVLSQGIILQNKDKLGNMLAHYTDEVLLSPDSIGDMFSEYRETFENWIKTRSVPLAAVYIDENRASLSDTASEKLFAALFSEGAARSAASAAAGIRLTELISEEEAVSTAASAVKNADIEKLFQNEIRISDLTDTARLTDKAAEYAGEYVSAMKWDKFYDKLANAEISEETAETLKKGAAEFISGGGSERIKNAVSYAADAYISERAAKSRTVGDMLTDKIKAYIDEGLDGLAEILCRMITEKARDFISEKQNSGNFMMRLVLSQVNPTLDYLKDVSIPEFVSSKTEEIRSLTADFIEAYIYAADKSVLTDIISGKDIDVSALFKDGRLEAAVEEIFNAAIDSITGEKVSVLAGAFGAGSFDELTSVYSVPKEMKNIFINAASSAAAELCAGIIPEAAELPIKVNGKIAAELTKEIIGAAAPEAAATAYKRAESEKTRVEALFDERTLCSAFGAVLGQASENEILRARIKALIAEEINFVADTGLSFITEDFCGGILGPVSKAAYESVRKYLGETVCDVNFFGVTAERIEALEPREVERLVRSFANEAFIRLEALGTIGAVFGINYYFSVIAAAADFVYDKIRAKKHRKDNV